MNSNSHLFERDFSSWPPDEWVLVWPERDLKSPELTLSDPSDIPDITGFLRGAY